MNFGHTLWPKFTIMPDGFIDLLYHILSFKQSLISRNKNIYGETKHLRIIKVRKSRKSDILALCQIVKFGRSLRPKFTIMPDRFIDLLYLILSFKKSLISRNKNIYGEMKHLRIIKVQKSQKSNILALCQIVNFGIIHWQNST